MVFTRRRDYKAEFVIEDTHNGNQQFETIVNIGANVDRNTLVMFLNAVNNQGITDMNLTNRTYTKEGRVLPIYSMCTGERVFLIATICAYTGRTLLLMRVMEQLSKDVLNTFLKVFTPYNCIAIYDSVGYYEARWNLICSS